jgi:crotonobetainyl-CoA:carnitine CoA-transferase CaiB-like acyl-CoA transferase
VKDVLTAADQPLAGKRILEVCHMLAGPYCGMLLADLGAEVIKIETGEGDIARQTGPHSVGPHNLYFASLNRNKKSVLLDLKTPQGRADFQELARSADALLTNLRPGAIRRLGLTYEALRHINPNLVCLAITGYGLNDPGDEPAYDYIIQALCGVMTMTGEPGSPPTRVGYSVVDNTSGMMGAIGLLAKLVSGRGGQVDVPLYDVMISQLNYIAAAYLTAGAEPVRQVGGAHAYFSPAQIFATRDGHLALFITHDKFWKAFCESAAQGEWVADPRCATMEARMLNRHHVEQQVGELLQTRNTEEWVQKLHNSGVVVAGVRSVAQALDGTQSSAMVIAVNTPHGVLRLVGNPIHVEGVTPRYEPPPLLGQHTQELCESDTARRHRA